MSNTHTLTFTAGPEHIDANGHVNNAVWVRWMEEVATAHWLADARPQDIAAYSWIVTRHEIDYRGNIGAGETVTAVTEVHEPARSVRFDRLITFRDAAGRQVVRAKTTWALLERATGQLARVTPELAAPFLPGPEPDA
jgi:acyl-CoA thioester hydrolase